MHSDSSYETQAQLNYKDNCLARIDDQVPLGAHVSSGVEIEDDEVLTRSGDKTVPRVHPAPPRLPRPMGSR